MLRNRSDDEMGFSFAQRNEAEDLFFSKGRYIDIPREFVGIDSLRERLSKVLLDLLIQELPSLKEEMGRKLQDAIDNIEKLGERRTTSNEQRMMLMKISMQVHDTLKSAVKGYYENAFFGPINMEAAVDATENICRLRAVVQHLNIKFSDDMRLRGHKYAIGGGPGDDEAAKLEAEDEEEEEEGEEEEEEEEEEAQDELDSLVDDIFLPKPTSLTREEGVAWVKKTLERSRGYELPGTFQPMLISQLFWEQSQPWEKIALEHITKVARACKTFVYAVLQHTAPAEFLPRILGLSVDAALKNSMLAARDEMKKVLADKSRHPMTYNRKFSAPFFLP